MALSGSIHRFPWHTPWMTDLPCFSKDRWKQRQKASVRTRTAIVDSSALPFGTGTSDHPELLKPLGIPRNPFPLLRFGARAMRSAVGLARSWFKGGRAQALFAGNSAHAIFPLQHPSSAGFGLMLSMSAHAVGWPIAQGGSQAIADALASYLLSLGGTIKVGAPVSSMTDLPTGAGCSFRRHPHATGSDRRLNISVRLSGATPKAPLRVGGLQGGLGAQWPHSMEGSPLLTGRHTPPGWHSGRNRRCGTGCLAGCSSRETVRAPVTAKPLRFEPCPRRYAHGLGVLSCSQWVHGRHDLPH